MCASSVLLSESVGSSKAGVGFPLLKIKAPKQGLLMGALPPRITWRGLFVVSARGALNTDRQEVTQEDRVDTIFQPLPLGPQGWFSPIHSRIQYSREPGGHALVLCAKPRACSLQAGRSRSRLNEAVEPEHNGVKSLRNNFLAIHHSLLHSLNTLRNCSLCAHATVHL